MSERQWYCPQCGPLCGNQVEDREFRGHIKNKKFIYCGICKVREVLKETPPSVLAMQNELKALRKVAVMGAAAFRQYNRSEHINTDTHRAHGEAINEARAAGFLKE